MVVGAVIIAAGHFSMAAPTTPTFFLGLALVAIGTGFFKVNASTMVGQLYDEHDARRDSGYTIFYMGVNVGASLGQFACGYFGESARWGWHYGFGAAGVGMLLGLAFYLRFKPKYLRGIGDAPNRARAGAVERRHADARRSRARSAIGCWCCSSSSPARSRSGWRSSRPARR